METRNPGAARARQGAAGEKATAIVLYHTRHTTRPVRGMQEVRTFRCRDLGLACEFEERAENENDLIKRVEGHVQTAHQMNPEQPEVQEKIRKAMK